MHSFESCVYSTLGHIWPGNSKALGYMGLTVLQALLMCK